MTDKDAETWNERAVMEAGGFQWDPSSNGYARWTCTKNGVQITSLRQPWMNDADWRAHCQQKLAEAATFRIFKDIPLGCRFQFHNSMDNKHWIFVKLDENSYVRWTDSNTHGEVRKTPWTDLELRVIEPLDGLSLNEQVALMRHPDTWRGLADWHDSKSAEAEAQDYMECSKYHDERAKEYNRRADAILRQWENG
jgi:hypothetical protein